MPKATGRILFDQGHEEDYLGAIMGKLIEEGYSVDTLEDEITTVELEQYSCFVISSHKVRLSAEEVKSVLEFHEAGNGVLLCGHYDQGAIAHILTTLDPTFEKNYEKSCLDWGSQYHKRRLDYLLLKRFFDYQEIFWKAPDLPLHSPLKLAPIESGLMMKLHHVFKFGDRLIETDLDFPPSSVSVGDIEPLKHPITEGVEFVYPQNEFEKVDVSSRPYCSEGITYFNRHWAIQKSVPLFLRRSVKFVGRVVQDNLIVKGYAYADTDENYQQGLREIASLNQSDLNLLQKVIEEKYSFMDEVGVATYPRNRRAVGIAGDLFSDQYIEQDKDRKANLRLALNVFRWLNEPNTERARNGKTRMYSVAELGETRSVMLPSGEIKWTNCRVLNSPKARYCKNCRNKL